MLPTVRLIPAVNLWGFIYLRLYGKVQGLLKIRTHYYPLSSEFKIVGMKAMFRCWLDWKHKFLPSTGWSAKILASVHQWRYQWIPNSDPWRIRPLSCSMYIPCIVPKRSLLTVVMTQISAHSLIVLIYYSR